MVSARVNDIASAASAGWLREGARIEDMRAGFDTMCPVPGPDVTVTQATVGGVPGAWGDVPDSGNLTFLHFHAGGYLIGSSTSHRDLASRMARASGGRVFLADYGLAPEHPFPAAFDDGLAAYRGMLEEGIDPATLIVSGDSAGGGLALALLAAIRDAGIPAPAAGVLMSPWADLTLAGDSMSAREGLDPLASRAVLTGMQEGYLQGADPLDHRASPPWTTLPDCRRSWCNAEAARCSRTMPCASPTRFCARAVRQHCRSATRWSTSSRCSPTSFPRQ